MTQIVPSGNWEALSQKIVIGLQFWLHKMWLKIILDIHGMTHCHNWYDKQVTELFYSAILRIFQITTVTWGSISLHSFDSIIKITHNKNNSSINNWISPEEKKNPHKRSYTFKCSWCIKNREAIGWSEVNSNWELPFKLTGLLY